MRPGFKRVIAIILIFLGPGMIIWWIAHTFKNHFLEIPYLGYEYTYDESGKAIDSVPYKIPDIQLTSFDGSPITRDSIQDKFIILTTIQDNCPDFEECGLGVYVFNEIIFSTIVEHPSSYSNVRVLSLLTDQDGNPDSTISQRLREEMASYDKNFWWFATGENLPFYNFNYYGRKFNEHEATSAEGEIGSNAFTSSLVLIDRKGHIRGVTGAKKDADMRNFFDLLKLLKKEEFNENREKNKK